MSDVFIVESTTCSGEWCVRLVFAADADDARATHALHFPGEVIDCVRPDTEE